MPTYDHVVIFGDSLSDIGHCGRWGANTVVFLCVADASSRESRGSDARFRLADGSGRTPLFMPDGKHPTSKAYESLWHRMRAIFSEHHMGFGLLAPQEAASSTLNAQGLSTAANQAMQ